MFPLVVIVGPTASGKTDAALQLARESSGAVVSADSRQIYAGLNIGTAKPHEAWRDNPHDVLTADPVGAVDHFLLNIASPAAIYTLASWQEAAFLAIDHIHAHSRIPYLVGGTMLYIDSVLDNFSLPHVPPNAVLREALAQRETADLYRELVARDPAAAQFVEPHHAQRIIRALEVIAATGVPFSMQREKRPPRYRTRVFGLFPGWEMLTSRITERAHAMLRDGLLDEVRELRRRYGTALPLLSTMNYREAGALLDGRLTANEAVRAMIRAHVRYARRQMSWWKQRKDIIWCAAPTQPPLAPLVTKFLSATSQ